MSATVHNSTEQLAVWVNLIDIDSPSVDNPGQPPALEAPVVEKENQRRGLSRLGGLAYGAFLAAEINPVTNEGMRVAAFALTQAATESPYPAAAAFTAATFLIEGAGAVAAARLMDTQRGTSLVNKVQSTLSKFGLMGKVEPKGNIAVESAVAMVAGAPAAVVLKQVRDRTRTFSQNLRYGLVTSAGISVATGTESVLISQGIERPNHTTVGAALLGLGMIVAGYKWAKGKIRREASEGSIEALSYADYRRSIEKMETGPQLHGFNQTDFGKVATDLETKWIEKKDDGRCQLWPVLTPIKNFSEYVPGFFERTYGADQKVYYLSLPPLDEVRDDPEFGRTLSRQLLQASKEEGALFVFDELVGADVGEYLRQLIYTTGHDASVTFDHFIEPKNDSPAQSIHYEADVSTVDQVKEERAAQPYSVDAVRAAFERRVASGEIDPSAQSVTVLLNPNQMELPYKKEDQTTLMHRMWDIYSGQFSELIENTPARGAQTYEELETMLTDPGTLTVAHIVDGEVVSFMMFVSNIDACDWLNTKFYKQQFSDETLLYAPGIATDKKMKGHHYSFDLLNTAVKLVTDVADDVRLVWQCTNISKDYIPRIVQQGINATGRAVVEEPKETARYSYVGMRIQ